MRILIDSHILIWLMYEPEMLSDRAKPILTGDNDLHVSTVSFFELAIKFSKKRLLYSPGELLSDADKFGLTRLPIKDSHIQQYPKIHLPHNDPFDRLLVAQSEAEGCTFMTADTNIIGSPYRITPVV